MSLTANRRFGTLMTATGVWVMHWRDKGLFLAWTPNRLDNRY
jgi:hypothetical protein